MPLRAHQPDADHDQILRKLKRDNEYVSNPLMEMDLSTDSFEDVAHFRLDSLPTFTLPPAGEPLCLASQVLPAFKSVILRKISSLW